MSDADFRKPATSSSASQWGIASLLIGCIMLLVSAITMVFNIQLFHGGPRGIDTGLALVAGVIGVLAVLALAVASLLFGIRSWQLADADGVSPALGISGVSASVVGLIGWLIAGIILIVILLGFK